MEESLTATAGGEEGAEGGVHFILEAFSPQQQKHRSDEEGQAPLNLRGSNDDITLRLAHLYCCFRCWHVGNRFRSCSDFLVLGASTVLEHSGDASEESTVQLPILQLPLEVNGSIGCGEASSYFAEAVVNGAEECRGTSAHVLLLQVRTSHLVQSFFLREELLEQGFNGPQHQRRAIRTVISEQQYREAGEHLRGDLDVDAAVRKWH